MKVKLIVVCLIVQKKIFDPIYDFLSKQDKIDDILIVGHSLGAGVAAILKVEIQKSLNIIPRCVLFGTPACLSDIPLFHTNIISIINEYDIVPRLSISTVTNLVKPFKSLIDNEKLIDSICDIVISYTFQSDQDQNVPCELTTPGEKILHFVNKKMIRGDRTNFNKIIISSNCINNHLLTSYMSILLEENNNNN